MECTEEGIFVEDQDVSSCLEYRMRSAQTGQTAANYPTVSLAGIKIIPTITFAMLTIYA